MDADFNSYMNLSAISTFQLLAIAAIGAFCTKIEIFDNKDIEGLFSLINMLLMPMLMFVQILKGFDITDVSLWLPVVIVIVIQVVLGIILGYAINYITCSDKRSLKFMITSLSFTQTKTLQLLLVDNFAEYFESISKMENENFSVSARDRALNYILLSFIIENFLRYTLGAYILTPGEEEVDDQKGIVYGELTGDEEADSREVAVGSNEKPSIGIYDIITPSLITFILAVGISFILPFKDVLLDSQNLINETIFVSSNLIGTTVKVMSIFVFGAALPTYSWEETKLSDMTLLLQAMIKLVVYPVLGIYIVFDIMFKSMNLIDDSILAIMMLIHFAAPTGVGLLTLVGQKGYLENDMGKSLTVQHLLAIITFTISNAIFMFFMANHCLMSGSGMDVSK
jgi:predicted permease